MFESLIRGITNEAADKFMEKLLTEKYESNLYVLVTAAQKMTLHAIIEASMRGETGKALSRSYGSPNVQSPWPKVFLNPTQLFSLPAENNANIDTSVVIGKNTEKPIKLKMPIMITGMSYGGSLSLKAKIALAKAASNAGTSTNTGESAISIEEREAADILIAQYNRYNLMRDEHLAHADGIEIQLGQGAWGGAVPKTIEPGQIDDHLREVWKLTENQPAVRGSRFPGVNSPEDIVKLVNKVKSDYPDIPVGVKIAATHFIEKELEVIIRTNADFIAIDGAEGGTAGAPAILEDDMGLPTIYAISRAARYLEQKGVKDKYDLIAAGGLKTPGDFLKALALGANAVYIGSIALVAMLQKQSTKATPAEPTPQLALYTGKLKEDFDIDEGVRTLTHFLKSCDEEMKLAMVAMGKTSLNQLGRSDLVSVDKDLAEALAIGYAGTPLEHNN
jgi:methylamine---glutamate N-methyltransferase subunit C